jgi:ribonuclease P protein component
MTAPTGRSPSLAFPQTHRLKTPAEFERCYARKRSASDGVLIVYACENDRAHPRLGCSVSRKVGNAVVRNRYKRLFREAFRLVQHELPSGVDLILIPRPGPEPTLEAVRASLLKLAAQAARKLGAQRPTRPAPKQPTPQPPPCGEGVNAGEASRDPPGGTELRGSSSPLPTGRGAGGVGLPDGVDHSGTDPERPEGPRP